MSEHTWQGPDFARKIIEKFVSSQANAFLVYGNTKDIYPVSERRYVGLTDFFVEALIKPRRPGAPKIVLLYDPAQGISFHDPLDRGLLGDEFGVARLDRILLNARQDIVMAMSALREFTRLNIMTPADPETNTTCRRDFAIIIRYGETVAPPAETATENDQLKVITLENWFSDSSFIASSDIVFLISETLTGINSRIVDLPFCAAIKIDRPKDEERRTYIELLLEEEHAETIEPIERISFNSAGLTLLSLRQIFRHAAFKQTKVTPELIFDKMKEIIEKELEGYIEFPKINYGFDKVIGAGRLLKKLGELKTCIKTSDPELMPVGILVPGANGVGKTYIYKAFAYECGWIAVVLKNIRGAYVGQTEKNWERIRSVLEAMGAVMVLYDEADTEIGGRGAQTHDVDRRLFGNILKMMSDPYNRGKIIWIIITARPDRLEPDIKRSGRAGEHLPVFDNEGEEKRLFINHVLGRVDLNFTGFPPELQDSFMDLTVDYYPADFDQILTELKRRRLLEGRLDPEMVIEEIRDFIPADLAKQREYQELLAVLECTSRELLPDKYAALPKEAVQDRLMVIKEYMGSI